MHTWIRTIILSLLAAAGVLVLRTFWMQGRYGRRASGRTQTHEEVVEALSAEEKERMLEELGGQVYGHV